MGKCMFSTKFTEWVILDILIKGKSLTTQQVHRLLKEEYNVEISLAQLYKVIKQMYDASIIMKDWSHLQLNMWWVNKIYLYAHQLDKEFVWQESVMKEGEHKFFDAKTIQAIDSPWSHVISQIYNEQQHEDLYFYDSHPYYFLYEYYFPLRLYHPFFNDKCNIYQLTWNNTFLDVYGGSVYKDNQIKTVYQQTDEFPKSWYSCRVIWDYIIETHLPEIIAWALDTYFEKVASLGELDLQEYAKAFSLKLDCKFLVRRNKKDAKDLASTIKSYFNK